MQRAECVSESSDSEVSTKECSLFIQAVLILTSLKYLGWSGDIAAATETTLGVCVAQPSSRCYPRLLQTASFLRTSLGKCTLFAAAAQVVLSVTAHEGTPEAELIVEKALGRFIFGDWSCLQHVEEAWTCSWDARKSVIGSSLAGIARHETGTSDTSRAKQRKDW